MNNDSNNNPDIKITGDITNVKIKKTQPLKIRIKKMFLNLLVTIDIIAFVASIFLGIWWDPFPFGKACLTEMIVFILLVIYICNDKDI